jgi:hypothetical protein
MQSRRPAVAKPFETKDVVVAIVNDPDNRFLVCFNERWARYTFPMTKVVKDVSLDQLALDALFEHTHGELRGVSAKPLEYVGGFGTSYGTLQDTYYNYHVYEVKLAGTPNLAPGQFGDWMGFVDYDRLQQARLVSWSAKEVSRALMERQQVALAIICRDKAVPRGRAAEKEVLLVQKASYSGYFFPVARVKEDIDPLECAQQAIRSDTGYTGDVTGDFKGVAETEHPSPRYGRNRKYQFYLYQMDFAPVQLSAANNALELSLQANKVPYGWFDAGQLADPKKYGLSPTVAELRLAALAACEQT